MKKQKKKKEERSVFKVDLDEIPNGRRCPTEFCDWKEEFKKQVFRPKAQTLVDPVC